ncbi:MAG TPA: cupin domain-containing protein [Gemmatimonadales bacterium]
MRTLIWTLNVFVALALPPQSPHQHPPAAGQEAPYANRQWQTMVPELGADSPQISILRVDPQTQATQLLIRIPKQMHVPMHWHSANETHTVIKGTFVFEHEGQRHQLGPGGFNYLPARMPHQAWASDDALVFITVDAGWDVNFLDGPPTKSDLGQWPSSH